MADRLDYPDFGVASSSTAGSATTGSSSATETPAVSLATLVESGAATARPTHGLVLRDGRRSVAAVGILLARRGWPGPLHKVHCLTGRPRRALWCQSPGRASTGSTLGARELMAAFRPRPGVRFLVGLTIGMATYFGYGRRHSRLAPGVSDAETDHAPGVDTSEPV